MHSCKGLLIVSVLWASTAQGAEPLIPQSPEIIELDEILVQGRKPANDAEKMVSWLSRLVGEFRYEGYVERPGSGETAAARAQVQGSSQCLNIGAPGLVQCQMNVTWQQMGGPDGRQITDVAAAMTPAIAIYGMYKEHSPRFGEWPEPRYIGHMQVDSRGVAETGIGQLFDDTLIYKATCADLPGNCQRVVQIQAPADRKVVQMSVEIQRDSKLEVRYVFQWRRVSETPAATVAEPAVVVRTDSSIVPADTQNWLRRLVGNFRLEHAAFDEFEPAQFFAVNCMLDQTIGRCPRDTLSRVECLGIGSGPGVRCMRDMGWQESRVPASRLKAAFELWGYDPVAKNVIYAWASPWEIDKLGGLEFAPGRLSKDTWTTTALCLNTRCISDHFVISPNGRQVRRITRTDLVNAESRLVRIDDAPAETTAKAPKARNPSPRRP